MIPVAAALGLLTSNVWRTGCLAALAVVAVQTARIDGLPVIGGGLKADLAASARQSQARLDAHVQTIRNYRAAQAAAAAAEQRRLARVRAEQKGIDDDVLQSYDRRIADLRARAGKLRGQGPAGADRASGAVAMPGVPAAPGAATQATCGDGFSFERKLIASEQAVQLDELIVWVRRQAGIDPNR